MRIIIPITILALLSPRTIIADTDADATASAPSPPKEPSVSSVSDLQEQLDYDENGKLTRFYLVYPLHDINNAECPAPKYSSGPVRYYEKVPLDGDALKVVFPDYDPLQSSEKSLCPAAWLERGTDRSIAGHTLPQFHYDKKDSQDFVSWFQDYANKKEVCFQNYYSRMNPVKVYWQKLDGSGDEELTMEISYGDKSTRCFNSYLGHVFRAYGKRDDAPADAEYSLLEEVTIDHVLVKAFGESPPHQSYGKTTKDFERNIESTLRSEWSRHTIPKRTFSPLGFAKGRLPNDVFASMGAFFYNNRHNKVREEWDGKGFFVNWWETDVFFVQIPWNLKEVYQIRLRDLVSEWAGTEVEQTVMYGLRQYESGARLLTHVDRLRTHAVSLIVNIAQGNLTQDWPVEVFDHNGRLHEVVMEPGDIVYYESAKNLHSRNRALSGANGYYVNMFTHYRPKEGGDNWYSMESENEPVLDVEGSCVRSDDDMDEEKGFGKVKCDDPRLGKNLSPSLFQAKNGEDLIQWWRHTTPGGYVGDTSTESGKTEEEIERDYEVYLNDDILNDEEEEDKEEDYDIDYDDDDFEDDEDEDWDLDDDTVQGYYSAEDEVEAKDEL